MNSATSSGENCGAWSAAEAVRAAARAEPAKPITEKMMSERGVAWDFIGRKRKSFGASRQLIRRLYLLEHGDVAAFFGGATGRTKRRPVAALQIWLALASGSRFAARAW